jgi:hypothetical protein
MGDPPCRLRLGRERRGEEGWADEESDDRKLHERPHDGMLRLGAGRRPAPGARS